MHNFALMLPADMMKRNIFFLFMTVIVACSCGDDGKKKQALADMAAGQRVADSLALKVGVMPVMDCLPLFIADETGIFDSLGVDIQLVYYDDGLDCCTDLMEGKIQGCVTDVVRAGMMQRKGCPLSYVTATDAYWQFVTNRKARINELKQMTNKMLAVTRFSAEEMLGDMAIGKAGINSEYVFRIQINNPALRVMMMRNNEMDAAMLPEPQAAVARQNKDTVLMDSRDVDLWLGAMVVRDDYAADERRATQVKRLAEAYDKAVAMINSQGVTAYKDIITRRMNIDETVVFSLSDIQYSHSRQPRREDIDRADAWLNEKMK